MNDLATKTFGEAIRHHVALILLVVALSGAAGLFAYRATPPTYQTSSQVYVDVSGNNSSNVDPSNSLLNSYWMDEATSFNVLQRAATKLGHGETVQNLQRSVQASILRSTNVVQVTASAWDPTQAADRANAVAQSTVEQARADAGKQNVQQQQVLQQRLDSLNPQIQQAQAALNANPNELSAQTRLNALYQSFNDTQNQLTQMQINNANSANQLRVIQQAPIPLKPTGPDLRLFVGGGLLVGLIVGVLLALLVERFDDRVLNSSQVGRAAGTSLVVGLPDSWRRPGADRNLYTLAIAHLFARHPDAARILAVAVQPEETAAEAAEQLGTAAAGLGYRAQVLGGATHDWRAESGRYEQDSDGEVVVEAAGGYVSSPQTVPLLATKRRRTPPPGEPEQDAQDVTIIATPSPMSSPAAMAAGRQADVAVVVVTARRTRLRQVRQAAEALRAAGVDVGGAILVPPPPSWLRRRLQGARRRPV